MVESVKRTDGVGAAKRKFCSVRPAARRFGSFRALRGQTSPPLVLLHAEYQRAKSKHGVDFWGVPNNIGDSNLTEEGGTAESYVTVPIPNFQGVLSTGPVTSL